MFSINQARSSIIWFMETSKKVKEWTQNEPQCDSIPFKNNIVLKDVNFSYNDNEDNFALKDINIEIKKGEFIGIVGLSGSGKTTIMDILSGLNTADSGNFSR